ncbi:MAG TPA: UrcA family protein [Caulobacteraceae bacterium]|jgi:UrcA family protein|nr:UrcA family protein [Caulobacteraceae bacterium]
MKRLLLAAAGALSVASFAHASEIYDSPRRMHVEVSTGDLDLATQSGAEALLGRIGEASMEACGAFQGSLHEYRWAVRQSGCYYRHFDRSVAQIDAPRVRDLYHAVDPQVWAAK